jgi:hypothetical protein
MKPFTQEQFWARVSKTDNCWEWQGYKNPQGYGKQGYQNKNWLTHRLSLYFSGIDIKDKIVCHHCDNPACVRPDHLYAGTKQDNSNDAKTRNRLWKASGIINPNNKLTDEQVLDIRNLKFGVAVEKYKGIVSRGHICHIKYNKKAWAHI